jgi:ribosomal protein L40E
MNTPKRKIPPERQTLHYVGLTFSAIGLISFLSVFLTAAMNVGNFQNFQGQMSSAAFRGFGGMILMMIGTACSNIAAKGLAGSGIVLDPEQAREDVEPWSRMTGGVLQDALSEVDVVNKVVDQLQPAELQIKVRCLNCKALNDETAKFCNQCGESLSL